MKCTVVLITIIAVNNFAMSGMFVPFSNRKWVNHFKEEGKRHKVQMLCLP